MEDTQSTDPQKIIDDAAKQAGTTPPPPPPPPVEPPTPIPSGPPPPPQPEEVPAEKQKMVDNILNAPTPPTPEPPKEEIAVTSPKKSGKGSVLAAVVTILLLGATIPLGVFYNSKRQQIADIRSQARECVTDDCSVSQTKTGGIIYDRSMDTGKKDRDVAEDLGWTPPGSGGGTDDTSTSGGDESGTGGTVLDCGNKYVSDCVAGDYILPGTIDTVVGTDQNCKGATSRSAECTNWDNSMGRGCKPGYYPCSDNDCCKIGAGDDQQGGGGGGGGNGGGDGDGDGGATPQCNQIKVYKDGQVISDVSSLSVNDQIVIAVKGGLATKARIRTNGAAWTETSTKNASDEYTLDFTILEGSIVNNKIDIEGEILGTDNNWH
ncbi:hypothetical protein A3A79_03345 [Candidatus Gottesmanbacteria bacterium RIFCSPLOWO2_01_FULL_43_11b]|uniref:Uncharacterized protein n=1 Tax=Candidatus Gottesmanbacteria bacterium RIFCSPLOWO2_01_FULL_43_11b TaxID=1798392 RepID=A0A1F6AIT8_9BACT|nr:MAG: hypothetical protein A3A79_03345 [Candidatus Gottesmanbacteria bacterium RIFCSPLOWO2_01_FULL_43_11b]